MTMLAVALLIYAASVAGVRLYVGHQTMKRILEEELGPRDEG